MRQKIHEINLDFLTKFDILSMRNAPATAKLSILNKILRNMSKRISVKEKSFYEFIVSTV